MRLEFAGKAQWQAGAILLDMTSVMEGAKGQRRTGRECHP